MSLTNLQATYGWYLSTITTHPESADVIFMGGVWLRRSVDGGATWAFVTPPHVDIHATEWNAATMLICGNDGGVHRGNSFGNYWERLNVGLGTIQFYAGLSTDPTYDNRILGGMQDNGSAVNLNDFQWQDLATGDGGWTQIDQRHSARLFVEYQGAGNLLRSTNYGNQFGGAGLGIDGNDRHCFLPPLPDRPDRLDPHDLRHSPLVPHHQRRRLVDAGQRRSH